MLSIVVDAYGTVPKVLERRIEESEIREKIQTIHIIALLGSSRILRRILETRGELL